MPTPEFDEIKRAIAKLGVLWSELECARLDARERELVSREQTVLAREAKWNDLANMSAELLKNR